MPRILAALLTFLFAGSILLVGRSAPVATPAASVIVATPVVFDSTDPGRDRAGGLRFLGGWELTSEDPDFGGVSAMALDGDRFTLAGDAGGVFRFRLDRQGTVSDAAVGALRDGPAPETAGETRKRDRDAEALARDPATGRFWVGFENANAIWRYDPRLERAEAHAAPEAMADWPENAGPEALVRLPGGRFIVLSEGGEGPRGSREGLVFDSDPADDARPAIRFGVRSPAGHTVTDAALLPDGRLLVLSRHFSLIGGVSIAVNAIRLDAIAEGAVLEGELLARLAMPLTVDNMEALAVAEENGRTVVWMASDDNFNPLQRTLLLKFALAD